MFDASPLPLRSRKILTYGVIAGILAIIVFLAYYLATNGMTERSLFGVMYGLAVAGTIALGGSMAVIVIKALFGFLMQIMSASTDGLSKYQDILYVLTAVLYVGLSRLWLYTIDNLPNRSLSMSGDTFTSTLLILAHLTLFATAFAGFLITLVGSMMIIARLANKYL